MSHAESAFPRTLANAEAVADRRSRLDAPHLEPLNELVRAIREQRSEAVPWFDPESGGVNARVLLVLEAPGPKAAPSPRGSKVTSSGFVSLDNDDQTAANLQGLVREAALERNLLLMWNIVPWYLGNADHTKIAAAHARDVDAGGPWLRELVALLGDLRVAVLLGEKALRGWFRVSSQMLVPVPVLAAPNPSPRSLQPHPQRRQAILEALRAARHFSER